MGCSRALVCLVLAVVLVVATSGPHHQVEATISCGQVTTGVAQCLGYLRGTVAAIPPACCTGVKGLNAAAKTTPDRQAACNCLKTAASTIKGLHLDLAAGLPGKCGVSIPYKISPTTDCTKSVVGVVWLVVAVGLVGWPESVHVEGVITCGKVTSSISQCVPYLQGKVPVQPAACCSGIKSLNGAATNTADRQQVCKCLKSASSSIPNINLGLANGLPGKCGVSIPYKISPSTDCTK
ncbi:lipid-transfer protein [Asimina triloba]